jgi:O-antigen/teichoic acid export membrane protein
VKVPQRVAFNTAIQLVARLFLTATGLAVFAIVTRHLGVAGYGAYSLVLALIPLFALFADLGVTTIAVREIAREPDERSRIVGTVMTVKAALAIVAALALLALIPVLPYDHELRVALAIALAGLILHLLATVPGVVFQSLLRLDLQVLVDLAIGVSNLLLVLLVVHLGGGLHALVVAWVVSTGVGSALAFGLALRLAPLRPRFERQLASHLLRRALPLGLVLVAGMVHFRVDAVLLSLLRPIHDVGVYNAAFRFLEQALLVPALFMTAIFPVLAAYAGRRDPRLVATAQKALTFLLLVAAPIAVGAFVLARPIVTVIAGPEFEESVTPLRILLVVILFTFVAALFTNLLIAYDRQGRLLVVSLLGIALNVTLNLILIPPYGYNGAAAGTVVASAGATAVLTVWALRYAELRIDWTPSLRILVAALAMGAIVSPAAAWPLAAPIVLGAAVYVTLAFALRIVGRRDLDVLLRGAD